MICEKVKSHLILIPIDGHSKWKLGAPFVFESEHAGLLTVPEGFINNLNSVPRVFWWISHPAQYPRSAVLHDYAYSIAMPRATADALYRESLECEGAHSVRRWVRWMGLRTFGWAPHRRARKKLEAQVAQAQAVVVTEVLEETPEVVVVAPAAVEPLVLTAVDDMGDKSE